MHTAAVYAAAAALTTAADVPFTARAFAAGALAGTALLQLLLLLFVLRVCVNAAAAAAS